MQDQKVGKVTGAGAMLSLNGGAGCHKSFESLKEAAQKKDVTNIKATFPDLSYPRSDST